jgi:antitoxin component YwqK of YwqJK toxin-antitoxin module
MKKRRALLIASAGLVLSSCTPDDGRNVISQRYIHKYGYDVSHDEWMSQQYPGQVLTTLRDGMTITETYEDGLLHGAKTTTYPHSQTIHSLEEYERGRLHKRITYSVRGVPQKEELFKSAAHIVATTWYPSGTPKSKEEFKEEILINGQYFTVSNETDSRVENGTGERTIRNQSGDLLSREVFNNYGITYIETYYPNNMPHTATSYDNGKIHGEKKVFAMSGEPLSVEGYTNGILDGVATYYQNGYKYLEIPYTEGNKNGLVRHYIDGETVVEETEYLYGIKQGPSIVYCDGSARTTWYFEDRKVTRNQYEQLIQRRDMIMAMQK